VHQLQISGDQAQILVAKEKQLVAKDKVKGQKRLPI
jgi:hypothetical protein